jgi:hypothetical protein
MEERVNKDRLLAGLRESLDSGDLEVVKRIADSLDKVGGDPVAALSSMALNELPDCDQRILALRALEHLDSRTAASVVQRLRGFSGSAEPKGPPPERLSARTTGTRSDPSKWWIIGPLIALAILWPAYSVYRFNHPKQQEPAESVGMSNPTAPSPPAVTIGQDKQITGDHRFGCSDREYFEKLVGYAVQKDNEAFSRGLASGILAGACTLFKSGESIYITDTAIFSGLVEVRPKGQVREYWTNLEAVN